MLGKDHILSGASAIAEVKDETASPLSPLEGIMSSLHLGNREDGPSVMGWCCDGGAWLSQAAQSVPECLRGKSKQIIRKQAGKLIIPSLESSVGQRLAFFSPSKKKNSR